MSTARTHKASKVVDRLKLPVCKAEAVPGAAAVEVAKECLHNHVHMHSKCKPHKQLDP